MRRCKFGFVKLRKRLSRKEVKLRKKTWITLAFLKSIKNKNKLYSLKMRNPFDESIAKKYKVYKNKLVPVKEVAKKLYYNNVIDNNKSDPQKTWRVINEILSQKHQKNNNIPSQIMDENNHTYANPIAISNAFNSYFARVGSTLASKIPAPSSKANRKMNSTVDSFFFCKRSLKQT